MSYSAEVFNVMIASPSEVAPERTIIKDVIYEWNAVHSKSNNIVLLPVGWESHSSPEMGASPQTIINNQVLDKCDLLIGVFWTRVGTPTETHVSGSVEEIERHIASGKPAMLYFSSKPVVPSNIAMKQYEELKQFKKSCQHRSLYEEYENHSDFKAKLYRHLQLKVNEHEMFSGFRGEVENDGIIEARSSTPSLSNEAKILLKEASLDPSGHVLYTTSMSGSSISTNGKNLIESNERREIAKWEAAINEFVSEEFLVERGLNGEVFEVSNSGYQTADMIEL